MCGHRIGQELGQIKLNRKDQNCSLQLNKEKLQNETSIFEKMSSQIAAEPSKDVGNRPSSPVKYNQHVALQNQRQHAVIRRYWIAAPVDTQYTYQSIVGRRRPHK